LEELSSIPPPPPPVIASTPSLISRINIGTATKNCSVEPATFAPLPANIAPVDRKPYGFSRVCGEVLNTPQALEAASRAGELNDQMAAQNANSEDVSLASQEGLEIRGFFDKPYFLFAMQMKMDREGRTNRSTVIVLKNMVTIEECDDELEGEIRDECTKYGQVEEVVIAQDPTNGSVKIFVRFGDIQEAEVARQALDKRYFAGKEISAQSYDQILFDHNDYTG
uniref:RRM domain-containing protein n=1 Tax=Parascaris equorum TaxID=6256 RepID=A0A914S2X2_PAREQ